jgi:hypothetical protein
VVGWVEENHCAGLLLVVGYDVWGCDDGAVMMRVVMMYFLD